ncbi:hypothetical protein SRHO_G00014380 [Serrasalmus rhombeus]
MTFPSTNVTLEILHSTRVAVAQFSQNIQGDGSGGKGMPPPPVLPLSGVMPSTVNGQAAVSQTSILESPPFLSSQPLDEQPNLKGTDSTSASLANPNPPLSTYTGASSLLPSCNGALSSSGHTQPLNSSGPLSVCQSSVLNPSANLPLLPQSPLVE